jgi:hypothetical protein
MIALRAIQGSSRVDHENKFANRKAAKSLPGESHVFISSYLARASWFDLFEI